MPDGMMIGHNGGPPMGGMMTYDGYTRDSAGAFLLGELERLDQTLHEPLVSIVWSREIDLREDVTTGDEWSSWTNSTMGAAGGFAASGISWAGKDTNAIQGVSLDIGKTAQPLPIWAEELSYSWPELVSAMQVGRPIDDQKYQALKLKDQMDTDQLVSIGDATINTTGLFNHAAVTNVTNVTGGGWSAGGADVIITQISELLQSVWQSSGFAFPPTELRVPPAQFSTLASTKVSTAGNVSVLRYLQENTIVNTNASQQLNIQPNKWLTNRGTGSTQRMVAYTKRYDLVRYPMTPLQRTPLEWRSLWNITTYWGRKGQVEAVYPETLGYRDGI